MAKLHQRIFAFFLAVLFLVTSLAFSGAVVWQIVQSNKSNKPTAQTPAADNTQQGENMLAGTKLNDFTTVDKIDALQKIDSTVGTGQEVKLGDIVIVHYTGAVAATGIIFQSSHDTGQPIPLEINQGKVIQGWVDGLPGMKTGGKRRILIPQNLAYADNPPQGSGIPPNADLVFDIELVKIGQ